LALFKAVICFSGHPLVTFRRLLRLRSDGEQSSRFSMEIVV
jgi:hypothetical protein